MSRDFVSIHEGDAEAFDVAGHDGQRLVLYRLHRSRAGAPAILFGHACGFAAGAYLPFLEQMAEFAQVFAFDARGHGGSQAHADRLSLYGPDDYAFDLACLGSAVATQAGGRSVHFVGHSLSAAAMLRLACCHPAPFAAGRWQGLVLFEPPIFPADDVPGAQAAAAQAATMAARARGRRADWPERGVLLAAIAGRGLFGTTRPEYLSAYVRAVLRPDSGGFRLACPPAVEAATFASFGNASTFDRLGDFDFPGPVRFIGGDAGATLDPMWPTMLAPAIAARIGCGLRGDRRFIRLPGCSHLMIQEDPRQSLDLVRDTVLSY